MKYVIFPHYTKIEGELIKTYGIIYFGRDKLIKIVKDVSVSRSEVKKLVKDLNEYKVELVHLYDIIEDFLYQ